jgi:hypothetical protein
MRMTLLRRSSLLLIALGLLARFVVLGIAPRYGYAWDHFDNIGMGRTAASSGLLRVYSVSKEDLAIVHGQAWKNGALETIDRRASLAPNYPPLAITIFLAQASVLAAMQGRLTANTFGARLVMASIPIAFEWITAVAAGAIAARLFGERRRRACGVRSTHSFSLPPRWPCCACWTEGGRSPGSRSRPRPF